MGHELAFKFLSAVKTRKMIIKQMLAEFLGTMVLIIVADSAAASYILNSRSAPVDNLGASFAASIGLSIGILISAQISGGHINPAVTIGLASIRKFDWIKVPLYLASQYLGAFVGSALVFSNNFNCINEFDFGQRSAIGLNTSTGPIFTTFPHPSVGIGNAILDQVICTGIFLFAINGLTDRKNLKLPVQMIPTSLGLVLCGLSVAFNLNCGAVLNPARDLSGRIFMAISGYGKDSFNSLNGFYWWTGGVLGPHLGGIVGSWIYYLTIELHHERESITIND